MCETSVFLTKNRNRVIDLTTPEKAEKYFNRLERERQSKNKLSFEQLQQLSTKEIDLMYENILKEQKERFEKERQISYLVDEKKELKRIRNSQYKHFFESKRQEYYQELRLKSKTKKDNYYFIDNLARRIRNNSNFIQFKSSFDLGLISDLKNLQLRVWDFTEKELRRLYDFSLNNSKKSFGM